jgi:hypothetical protein
MAIKQFLVSKKFEKEMSRFFLLSYYFNFHPTKYTSNNTCNNAEVQDTQGVKLITFSGNIFDQSHEMQ